MKWATSNIEFYCTRSFKKSCCWGLSDHEAFKVFIAGFINLAVYTDIAVNHVLITSIALNSILTAFAFWNVPNSNIYFGNALISDFTTISTLPLILTILNSFHKTNVAIKDNALVSKKKYYSQW